VESKSDDADDADYDFNMATMLRGELSRSKTASEKNRWVE
jgi:hypothetical protein